MVQTTQRPKLRHTKMPKVPIEVEKMQNLFANSEKTEHCCEEHRRRLELFCKEDEMLLCVQCVPTHSTHSFVFLHEAGSMYKDKLTTSLSFLESKVKAFQEFRNRLVKEFVHIQEDANNLQQHITTEFGKLHQFLQDHERKHTKHLKNIEGEILKEIEENLECIKNYVLIQQAVFDVNSEIKQEEAEFHAETEEPSGYIKNDVPLIHEVLSDVALEYKSKQAETLKEMVESLDCIKNVMTTQKVVSDVNMENENKEREISEAITASLDYINNCIVMTQETESDVNLEIKREEAGMLKGPNENFELSKYSAMPTLEEAPHVNLVLKSEKDLLKQAVNFSIMATKQPLSSVTLDFKTEETDILKDVKDNTECIKQDIVSSHTAVPDVNLEAREEECVGFMTVPETSEGAAAILPDEESKLVNKLEKDLHQEINLQNVETLVSAGIRSTECIASSSHQPSSGTSHLHHTTKNWQQFMQPEKSSHKFYLTPLTKLHTEQNCSKRYYSESFSLQQRGKMQQRVAHEKPYRSTECYKTFAYQNALLVHQHVHTGEKLYKCGKCNKSFRFKTQFLSHQHVHREEKPYKCTECTKSFTVEHSLLVHQGAHRGQKPYVGDECNKSFTHNSHFIIHHRVNNGEKPYNCAECSKKFTKKHALIRHQRVHTGEKPYKCAECNKSFTENHSMKRHQRVHTGEKPYKCMECSKTFINNHSLVVHRRVHTGEKPYKCAECGKSFAQQNNLIRHHRVHTREKLYKCTHCHKSFTRQINLVTHQKVHR